MNKFSKPKVIISKCIEFDYCRWNGNIIRSPFVQVLKSYVDFQPICPEFEIGLGIPRDPIKLVQEGNNTKLLQPKTGKEFPEQMKSFSEQYSKSIKQVDGFVLKARSPSCGILETRYYKSINKGAPFISRGAGIFGKEMKNRFPNKAIETEERLRNFRIREHWLIKLFTIAKFREMKEKFSKNMLVNFQANNKFTMLAYNETLMRKLGRIAANPLKSDPNTIIENYEKVLNELLSKPPEFTAHINVLMHIMGFFKSELSHNEKLFFQDELEKYRAGRIPLFYLLILIKSWIARFKISYLYNQSYIHPYPEELMNFDLKNTLT